MINKEVISRNITGYDTLDEIIQALIDEEYGRVVFFGSDAPRQLLISDLLRLKANEKH